MSADKVLPGSIFTSFSAFCRELPRRPWATATQACPIFPDFKSGWFCGLVQLWVLRKLSYMFSHLNSPRSQRTLSIFLTFTALIVFQHSIKRADPFYDIPGPFLARWTPLWLAYQVRRGRKYLVVDGLHKVHPSTIALHLRSYVLDRNMENLFASLQIISPLRTRKPWMSSTDKEQPHSTSPYFMTRSLVTNLLSSRHGTARIMQGGAALCPKLSPTRLSMNAFRTYTILV